MDKEQFWDALKTGVFASMVKESVDQRAIMTPT